MTAAITIEQENVESAEAVARPLQCRTSIDAGSCPTQPDNAHGPAMAAWFNSGAADGFAILDLQRQTLPSASSSAHVDRPDIALSQEGKTGSGSVVDRHLQTAGNRVFKLFLTLRAVARAPVAVRQ
jgi:hypothetical protein